MLKLGRPSHGDARGRTLKLQLRLNGPVRQSHVEDLCRCWALYYVTGTLYDVNITDKHGRTLRDRLTVVIISKCMGI